MGWSVHSLEVRSPNFLTWQITIFLHSKIQRRGAQRSQLLPPLFLSPTVKSNVAVIIQHKSMKQSKQLVPKFILTRQGISVQIGPYLSHKAV